MERDQGESPEGDVPLSALLAPSLSCRALPGSTKEKWQLYDKLKLERNPPSAAYIAALRAEGKGLIKQKPPPKPNPIDAEDYTPELQIFFVKLAAREGDWRSLRGTKPTPAMQNYFVIARAKYLAWKKRHDEEDEREEQAPKFWFEIEPGHWVRGTNEASARAFLESMKTTEVEHHVRERPQFDIDMSKTCQRCKMRRIEPGTALCGNCRSMGYT